MDAVAGVPADAAAGEKDVAADGGSSDHTRGGYQQHFTAIASYCTYSLSYIFASCRYYCTTIC